MKNEFELLFNNLFERKLIFHERATSLCELVNYKLKEDRFKVELKFIKLLSKLKPIESDLFVKSKTSKTFTVGSIYEFSNRKILNNKKIGRPYCPYTIWCDPVFVKTICQMNEYELEKDLWDLLW